MNNNLKLKVFILMLILIVCSIFNSFADSIDYLGHWAQKDIEFLMDKNIINGYKDGSYRPNNGITRAEFVKIINNVFGFSKKGDISFSDVKKADWFYEDIKIAVCAGYVSGYEDNTLRPNNLITRQEAAKIISTVYDFIESNSVLNFKDEGQIDSWAKNYIIAVNSNGVMNGYNDNTFRPTQNITRAEMAKIICNASGDIFNTIGEFSKVEKSNAIINKQNITLKDITIDGNLYLTEGIGDGNVTLENVTIKGRLIVSGGGKESIHIINSNINELYVNRKKEFVRVVLENVSVSNIVAFDNSIIVITKKTSVENITINGEVRLIVDKLANVDTVKVNSKNVEITLDGTIGKIDTSEDVNINGKIYKKGNISFNEKHNTTERPNKPEEPSKPEQPEAKYSFNAELDKEKYDVNEIITITEKVCKDNTGLENVDITFKLYGDNLISIDQFTTNSSGVYEYKFKVPDETDTGSYKILLFANEPVNKVIELSIDIDGNILINKDKLNEKIIEAEKLIEDEYTKETWILLRNSLKTAKNVLIQEKLTQLQIDEALKNLDYSISMLVKKATIYRSELQKKIVEVELLIENDYTVESWTGFQLMLKTAQGILSNDNSTYMELEDAINNLSDAMNSLKKIEKADKKFLKEEIAKVTSLIEDEYSEDSWIKLQEILNIANYILLKKEATQKEVDKTLDDLKNTIDSLVKKGEELNVQVTFNYKECVIIPNGYTEDLLITTTGLTDEEIASVVVKSNNDSILSVTQRPEYPEEGFTKIKTRAFGRGKAPGEAKIIATVTSKDGKLYRAECKVTVIKPAKKELLNGKIKDAKKLLEKDYVEETWSNFNLALNEADIISKKTLATQEEVDKALADLENAIGKLEKIESIDKKALQLRISDANNLVGADYTEDTWKMLVGALSEAEKVSQNDNATQEEVNKSLTDLNNAINSLENIKVSIEDIGLQYYQNGNKVGLMISSDSVDSQNYFRALIGEKISTVDLYSWYGIVDIDISIDEFENLLKASEEKIKIEILDDENGTNVIERKIVVLKLNVNKKALQSGIKDAKSLLEANYTEDTWKLFVSALNEAEKVSKNANATQEEVDKALDDLNNAVKGLSKIKVNINLEYYDGSLDFSGTPVMFEIDISSYNTTAKYYKVILDSYTSTVDSITDGYGSEMEISIDEFEALLKEKGKVTLVLMSDNKTTELERIEITPILSE